MDTGAIVAVAVLEPADVVVELALGVTTAEDLVEVEVATGPFTWLEAKAKVGAVLGVRVYVPLGP